MPKKEHILKTHVDLIEATGFIKSHSESLKNEINNWPGQEKADGKSLYFTLKAKSDSLIDKYQSILPDWRKARRLGLSIDDELQETQQSYNEFATFYNNNLSSAKSTNSKSINFSAAAELIELVLGVAKGAYELVKGISDDRRKEWAEDIEKKRLEAW